MFAERKEAFGRKRPALGVKRAAIQMQGGRIWQGDVCREHRLGWTDRRVRRDDLFNARANRPIAQVLGSFQDA